MLIGKNSQEPVNNLDKRELGRLKSINLTKLHSSYQRYIKTVPVELRCKSLESTWHPTTPNIHQKISHSQWLNNLKTWRKQVYLWNDICDHDCEVLKSLISEGQGNLFSQYCDKFSKQEEVSSIRYKLFDSNLNALDVRPVLYKPSWFNGELIHKGFETVEECECVEVLMEIGRIDCQLAGCLTNKPTNQLTGELANSKEVK